MTARFLPTLCLLKVATSASPPGSQRRILGAASAMAPQGTEQEGAGGGLGAGAASPPSLREPGRLPPSPLKRAPLPGHGDSPWGHWGYFHLSASIFLFASIFEHQRRVLFDNKIYYNWSVPKRTRSGDWGETLGQLALPCARGEAGGTASS